MFDDNDPEVTAYIGLAKIPLVSLSQDKPINGTFELRQVGGTLRLATVAI